MGFGFAGFDYVVGGGEVFGTAAWHVLIGILMVWWYFVGRFEIELELEKWDSSLVFGF